MSDEKFCMGYHCPLKSKCSRYTEGNDRDKNYYLFTPYLADTKTCPEFKEKSK